MRNMADMVSKFTKLNFLTSKKHLIAPVEPEAPSEEQIEEEEIASLGRYPECESLLKSLRRRLDVLEVRMMESIESQPAMCSVQGAKQEVRSIIAQLEGKEK